MTTHTLKIADHVTVRYTMHFISDSTGLQIALGVGMKPGVMMTIEGIHTEVPTAVSKFADDMRQMTSEEVLAYQAEHDEDEDDEDD